MTPTCAASHRRRSSLVGAVVALVVAFIGRTTPARHDRRPRRRPRRPRCGRCAASPNRWSTRSARSGCRARSTPPHPVRAPASSSTAATAPSPRTACDTPLIGASTQKLLVAAAALSIARTGHPTYQTRAVAPAAPDDGTVDRLWLVGGGDPVLTTGDYRGVPAVAGQDRKATSRPASRRWPTRSWPRACSASPAGSSATTPATTPAR